MRKPVEPESLDHSTRLDRPEPGSSSAFSATVAGDVSDARSWNGSRIGEDRGFAILVGRYERKLIRVLTRLVRDQELARDLAQETFWKVYNRLDRFDTARRFGPWLFRIGVNLGLDHLRRHVAPVSPMMSLDRSPGDHGGGNGSIRPARR